MTPTVMTFILDRMAETEGYLEEASTVPEFIVDQVKALHTAVRKTINFHDHWPIMITHPVNIKVDTPTDYDSLMGSKNQMLMSLNQQIDWVTVEKFREEFGDEPPTAPILKFFASIWDFHPDFNPDWKKG